MNLLWAVFARQQTGWFWGLMVGLLFLLGCRPEAAPIANNDLMVWLDQPIDGAFLPLQPLTLKAHARDVSGGGITAIAFVASQNGVSSVLGSVATDSSQALVYAELSWLPPAGGPYVIQAQAFTAVASALSARAAICVGGVVGQPCLAPAGTSPTLTLTPTASPLPSALTPTIAPTSLPSPLPTNLPTPTATLPPPPTLTPSPTATPTPALIVDFTADSYQLLPGECTSLRWNVQNATAVFLDGQGVAGVDSREVCLRQTTTFALHIEAPSGNVDKLVTIEVVFPTLTPTPTDQTGPSLSDLHGNPDPSTYGSGCIYNEVSLYAIVVDPAGIATVEMWYRYENSFLVGEWQAAPVAPIGGDYYAGSLDNNANDQALSVLDGTNGFIRWYVLATDTLGNQTVSGDLRVGISYCQG